jgi:hypothetical protein
LPTPSCPSIDRLTTVAGTISSELPELAEWTRAGLIEQGRTDLVDALERQPIDRCEFSSSHAALFLIPEDRSAGYMANTRRERTWVGRPKGPKKRRWGVSIDAIDGEIVLVAISHVGILRSALEKLSRD